MDPRLKRALETLSGLALGSVRGEEALFLCADPTHLLGQRTEDSKHAETPRVHEVRLRRRSTTQRRPSVAKSRRSSVSSQRRGSQTVAPVDHVTLSARHAWKWMLDRRERLKGRKQGKRGNTHSVADDLVGDHERLSAEHPALAKLPLNLRLRLQTVPRADLKGLKHWMLADPLWVETFLDARDADALQRRRRASATESVTSTDSLVDRVAPPPDRRMPGRRVSIVSSQEEELPPLPQALPPSPSRPPLSMEARDRASPVRIPRRPAPTLDMSNVQDAPEETKVNKPPSLEIRSPDGLHPPPASSLLSTRSRPGHRILRSQLSSRAGEGPPVVLTGSVTSTRVVPKPPPRPAVLPTPRGFGAFRLRTPRGGRSLRDVTLPEAAPQETEEDPPKPVPKLDMARVHAFHQDEEQEEDDDVSSTQDDRLFVEGASKAMREGGVLEEDRPLSRRTSTALRSARTRFPRLSTAPTAEGVLEQLHFVPPSADLDQAAIRKASEEILGRGRVTARHGRSVAQLHFARRRARTARQVRRREIFEGLPDRVRAEVEQEKQRRRHHRSESHHRTARTSRSERPATRDTMINFASWGEPVDEHHSDTGSSDEWSVWGSELHLPSSSDEDDVPDPQTFRRQMSAVAAYTTRLPNHALPTRPNTRLALLAALRTKGLPGERVLREKEQTESQRKHEQECSVQRGPSLRGVGLLKEAQQALAVEEGGDDQQGMMLSRFLRALRPLTLSDRLHSLSSAPPPPNHRARSLARKAAATFAGALPERPRAQGAKFRHRDAFEGVVHVGTAKSRSVALTVLEHMGFAAAEREEAWVSTGAPPPVVIAQGQDDIRRAGLRKLSTPRRRPSAASFRKGDVSPVSTGSRASSVHEFSFETDHIEPSRSRGVRFVCYPSRNDDEAADVDVTSADPILRIHARPRAPSSTAVLGPPEDLGTPVVRGPIRSPSGRIVTMTGDWAPSAGASSMTAEEMKRVSALKAAVRLGEALLQNSPPIQTSSAATRVMWRRQLVESQPNALVAIKNRLETTRRQLSSRKTVRLGSFVAMGGALLEQPRLNVPCWRRPPDVPLTVPIEDADPQRRLEKYHSTQERWRSRVQEAKERSEQGEMAVRSDALEASLRKDEQLRMQEQRQQAVCWSVLVPLAVVTRHIGKYLAVVRLRRMNQAAALFLQRVWRGNRTRDWVKRFRRLRGRLARCVWRWRMGRRIQVRTRAALRVHCFLEDFCFNTRPERMRLYARRFMHRVKHIQRCVRSHRACNAGRCVLISRLWRFLEEQVRETMRLLGGRAPKALVTPSESKIPPGSKFSCFVMMPWALASGGLGTEVTLDEEDRAVQLLLRVLSRRPYDSDELADLVTDFPDVGSRQFSELAPVQALHRSCSASVRIAVVKEYLRVRLWQYAGFVGVERFLFLLKEGPVVRFRVDDASRLHRERPMRSSVARSLRHAVELPPRYSEAGDRLSRLKHAFEFPITGMLVRCEAADVVRMALEGHRQMNQAAAVAATLLQG
jgi:hypothetical protein